MSELFPLTFDREPPSATQKRDRALRLHEKRIGRLQFAKLRQFVLDLLYAGQLSGEQLTDRAKLANLLQGDERKMGAVLGSLSREGLIAKAGFCARRKGNQTAGGIIWTLSQTNN